MSSAPNYTPLIRRLRMDDDPLEREAASAIQWLQRRVELARGGQQDVDGRIDGVSRDHQTSSRGNQMTEENRVPFHKSMSISSPWRHVGDTDVAIIGRNPDSPDMGRVSLMIHSGAANMNLRPTIEELSALRDLITAALYAEAVATFRTSEPA